MTDTERKYPLSDAALLTATDDELHADWSTRFRLSGSQVFVEMRDAIVRAATAKVRAEYEEREAAVCPEDVGFEEYIRLLRTQVARLRAQLATARTDAAREALQYVFRQFDLRPAVDKDVALAVVGCALRDREYPAPREEAVTDVLDLAVWGKGPDGEDIPCNLRLTPKDAAAIVTLARVAGREP